MRTESRTHLSVVGGKARVARVTVAACSSEEKKMCLTTPEYLLNERVPLRLSEEDQNYIRSAQDAAYECWSKLAHKEEFAVVMKIDLPIVDMHIEAVKAAATEATKALFQNENHGV